MTEERNNHLGRLIAAVAGAVVAPVLALAPPAHAADGGAVVSNAAQKYVVDHAAQPNDVPICWGRFGEFVQALCGAVPATKAAPATSHVPDLKAVLRAVAR